MNWAIHKRTPDGWRVVFIAQSFRHACRRCLQVQALVADPENYCVNGLQL